MAAETQRTVMIVASAIVTSSAFRVLSSSSSVHASLRDELTQIRDCFFFLLLACTVLVALGVALEEADNWLPSGRTRLNMLNGTFSPSPWVEWKRRLSRLGWILILLGVVGEGLFEGATSWTDSKLQDWSNTLLLNTEALTGNAAKSAKIAHEEVNAVKGIADAAKKDAEEALVKAKAAEKKLAWRDLTPQQQSKIASAVRKFGPKKYSLIIWGNMPEITRIAEKVLNTLAQADWTPDGWGFAMGGSANGVLVSTEKGAPTDVAAAADALVIAFNAKGIGIVAAKAPEYDHGSLPTPMTGPWKGEAPIRVVVGTKP
jgi:hypothetical protein